ncbi:MAG: ATP-binding protein [Aggregatilineales bacterium]
MASDINLDIQQILDGLGHSILIFDSENQLIKSNESAKQLIGKKDLKTIENNGWEALSTLLNARQKSPDDTIEAVRAKVLDTGERQRFHIYHSGEYVPCWMVKLPLDGKKPGIMITLDQPDWAFVTQTIEMFRTEMDDAIRSTQGHIDIIQKTIKHQDPDSDVESLSRRIGGFTRLISVHMYRVGRLMTMLERLEEVRTGHIKEIVEARVKKIDLSNFMEDFEEELDEIMLVDPETEATDHRSRLTITVPEGLFVNASPSHLTRILHDMLRNAIMYSMKATPIKISVQKVKDTQVQIDLEDEGYGVREKEQERVFEAFKRARQPQIISEFGYGLSLHLCRHEVEAMNGKMWFNSTENVGAKFSLMLPLWQDKPEVSSSSSDTS